MDQIINNLRLAQARANQLKLGNILSASLVRSIQMIDKLGCELINRNKVLSAYDGKHEYGLAQGTEKPFNGKMRVQFLLTKNITKNPSVLSNYKVMYFGFFTDHLNLKEIWSVPIEPVREFIGEGGNTQIIINDLWVYEQGERV